ncbi:siphovirus ReqiPepy6 Gp37-like family protein [Caproiciproducens galactitolivorans]|uniref:siphovirus ReqiPepy6 Gp37-like family protein n=1 Tax=Caproiciproducens galactitolivorans TaxID=642589 RepID=UPI002409BD01|nr:siphovirus ReqiPepy6 Gp37-like family protein [Caproiciproducens galactitolivorans]
MELYVYDSEMTLQGVVEKITSLIWTRRYWSCGEFKLLVPFTEQHSRLLVKKMLIMKRGDNEAGEIRYVNIKKNSQGLEEIEVQGKFITSWIGKRIVRNQIITTDNTQNILYRIVSENITNPSEPERAIPNVHIANDPDTGSGNIDYVSEPFINALLACETAAKAAKLGYKIYTDVKTKQHYFSVYEGRDLTADQTENPPCVFSQEFDNIVEQEYTNSIENYKTTAYVGGEEIEGVARKVAISGSTAAGLDRDEVFVNATDIKQSYEENEVQVTLTDQEYLSLLAARGASELEQYAETLSFSSNINTHGNLKYKEDYDLGDRVTCINKRWGIKINVRITEIAETYQQNIEEIDIIFGESLPALIDKIRKLR